MPSSPCLPSQSFHFDIGIALQYFSSFTLTLPKCWLSISRSLHLITWTIGSLWKNLSQAFIIQHDWTQQVQVKHYSPASQEIPWQESPACPEASSQLQPQAMALLQPCPIKILPHHHCLTQMSAVCGPTLQAAECTALLACKHSHLARYDLWQLQEQNACKY